MNLALLVLVVVVAMAVNDGLAVVLVVAENNGRPLLAGACDAAGDLARLVYLAAGIDSVLHGIDVRAVCVVTAMVATSFLATAATTRWARRIKQHQQEVAA